MHIGHGLTAPHAAAVAHPNPVQRGAVSQEVMLHISVLGRGTIGETASQRRNTFVA